MSSQVDVPIPQKGYSITYVSQEIVELVPALMATPPDLEAGGRVLADLIVQNDMLPEDNGNCKYEFDGVTLQTTHIEDGNVISYTGRGANVRFRVKENVENK